MRLGLETSSIGSRINIFGSEQIRYVTGGITIDSSEITAVEGVKEVKAGTVMGKQNNGLYIPVTDKVAAKLVTGIVGSNNAILWTAKVPGAAGETIKVQLLDPSANSQDLAVSVVGDTVVASLKTGSGGAIESTAAQVIAAVNAHLVAKTLVIAANSGASTGAGVVAAVAATALDNGADWNVTPSCILAEDVDVTDGDTAASAVDHARLLSARLPATIAPEVLAVLPGITLV
jgi:hypothetical protein